MLDGIVIAVLSIHPSKWQYCLLTAEGLFSFQEKILVKFGFIPFCDPSTDNQRNFVHVSGSIFVMIPNKNPASSPSKNLNKRGKFLMVIPENDNKIYLLYKNFCLQPNDLEMACSPHEEYITRHFSGMQTTGQSVHNMSKVRRFVCKSVQQS